VEMKTQERPWRWEEDGLTVTRTASWSGPGCHNACGLLVYSKDNRIVKVEGDPDTPFNQGRLCIRCLSLPKVVHHPDRLTHPLKRVGERGEGKWEPIPWDEAYDAIVEQVRKFQTEYGPESILAFTGTARNTIQWPTKLCQSGFGSPNGAGNFLSGICCYLPRLTLLNEVQGNFAVADYSQMFPDRFENPDWVPPKCIVIWGNNPVVTNADSSMGYWVVECMKRGSKLIVIDPRLTWLASRAHLWLQLRPGTDAALALAMLNVIIEEELYDEEFVEKWSLGFERLQERVQEYTPEKAAEISWVPKEKIIEAARFYATSKPASIQWGVAVDQSTIAMSTILSLTSLWALTGNLDVPGGNILNVSAETPEVPPLDWGIEDLSEEMQEKRIGKKEYPWFFMPHPDMTVESMITQEPYPTKMLWLQGTNPLACMASDPRTMYKAIMNMEFVVVVDLFMTPTAMACADIVLPASTGLERNSFRNELGNGRSFWGPARAINKIVQVGECKSDEEIVFELGKRLNPKGFPWENVEGMIDSLLVKGGLTFKELREKGPGEYRPFKYKKYEKGLLRKDGKPGFNTETGKFMFYVPAFEEAGIDPLPYYEEPVESPISTPELAETYPLILTTGARFWGFFHSEHRQIPQLREMNSVPITEIHPETARKYGIKDGDWVWIENRHGRFKQVARLTPTIEPRVVSSQHGWWFPEKPGPEPSLFGVWESNPNVLSPWGLVGPSGYGAPLKSQICRIYRVKEEEDA